MPAKNLPEPTAPPGLSAKRSEYLFQSIREYCTPQTRDITCPPPPAAPALPDVEDAESQLEDSHEESSDEDSSSSATDESEIAPPKRRR